MSINLDNLKEKLDLEDVDTVSPISILENTAAEMEGITKGLVKGVVAPYDGPIKSYSIVSPLAALAASVAEASTQTHNIQEDLGKIGYNERQYDFCLIAPNLPNYKYRVLFMSIGIGGYPVEVVLQEEIAQELFNGRKYVITVQNRGEYETILQRVFSSDKMIGVIQELIYAAQIDQTQSVDGADISSIGKQGDSDE